MIMINSSSKPQFVKHISKHLFKVMLGNKLYFKTLRQDKLIGKYSKQRIQNKYINHRIITIK